MRLGLDIGSVSSCAVILDDNHKILATEYLRHQGDPITYALGAISKLTAEYQHIDKLGFTGNGALQLARFLKAPYINEFTAISAAVARLLPGVQTIFEMGGQQAKYIHLSSTMGGQTATLDDFAASGLCAAGTGSFLDQQANRLGIDIEKEFGPMAVQSVNPPHIAGRCSVFAKSDMIHHQQRGVPVNDIIAGLCYAVARNFKGTIAKSKKLAKPIVFLGGVASNPGVVKAFRDIFELADDELIIPDWHNLAAALGAAISASEFTLNADDLERLNQVDKSVFMGTIPRAAALEYRYSENKHYEKTIREQEPRPDIKAGYLGIDIGSLSTNVVLISRDGEVISRRYLMTAGRPIEAMQRGLREIKEEIAPDFQILGVGTTGSGRYLIGELVGADIIRNEITAQANGGALFIPDADTIFEIGGQDSKYIGLENGVVVDFEMNRACAAGTGSFLEEQAERLGINIKNDFAQLAFNAQKPVSCGERCTVFMESDLVRFEQGGASKEEIAAGLAFAVVHNYINKVVGRRKIGNKILFQGGVAWNKAVVAAFEAVTGKEVIVPPHHDVTGAIGVALLARNADIKVSKFKGFELALRKIEQETFLCEDCANLCNITRINDNGRELYYGSRCEKYDAEAGIKETRPNPVAIRNQKFLSSPSQANKQVNLSVGLPRALANWEFFYLWRRFFNELGVRVFISRKSAGEIIKQGVESVGSETCFPVKVAHGHLLDLARRKIDFIFLPSIVTGMEPAPSGTNNFYCPYIQAFPYVAMASIKELAELDVVIPIIRFDEGPKAVTKVLYEALKKFGLGQKDIESAYSSAITAFDEFKADLRVTGREYLEKVSDDNPGILLVGRPYNSLDPGVSMDVASKLTDLGVTVIPMDMVDLPDDEYGFIYWQSGRRILRAAKLAKETPGLYPVYISNFGCGPDSFILHHFKAIMSDKPHLILELDEHSADAGLITRCEAFLDSLPKKKKIYRALTMVKRRKDYGRRLLIPRMCDHAELFAAALRYSGLDASALPETDNVSVEIGRKLTGGRECYPAVLTTGDLVRELQKPGTDPNKVAFFMPTAGGPCRFGQYQHMHKQILENIGYENIPIYAPNSGNSYDDFPETERGFRRLAWKGFLVADYMRKFLLRSRPYEKSPGAANDIYGRFMKEAEKDIESGGARLPQIIRAAFFANREIIDPGQPRRPRVGVIGEIYIRNNPFSNNNLAIKLETAGLEANISAFSEWIHFTTEMFKRESWRRRSMRGMLDATVKEFFQKRDERWVVSAIADNLDGHLDRPVEETLQLVEPYLPISVGGEAMPAMGKAIDLIGHGCAGIVSAMPFTCMPGNIINAISTRISEDYKGFPWLNMAYDGASGENDMVKLGAFAESVKSWAENNPAPQGTRGSHSQ